MQKFQKYYFKPNETGASHIKNFETYLSLLLEMLYFQNFCSPYIL